jgi:hypothetical protein
MAVAFLEEKPGPIWKVAGKYRMPVNDITCLDLGNLN